MRYALLGFGHLARRFRALVNTPAVDFEEKTGFEG